MPGKHLALSVLPMIAALLPVASTAQEQLLTQYHADIGTEDYYANNGTRLNTLAALLAQDRANYHKNGIRDGEDSNDPIFGDEDMRRQINIATVHVASEHAPYVNNMLACRKKCGTYLIVKVFGADQTITRISVDIVE